MDRSANQDHVAVKDVNTQDERLRSALRLPQVAEWRDRASLVERVEGQNAELRARLSEIREMLAREKEPPSIQEHERLRAQHERCKVDFRRVMEARAILAERCHHLIAIQKEWKAFYQRWLQRHPEADADMLKKDSKSSGLTSSSAAIPPECPATVKTLNRASIQALAPRSSNPTYSACKRSPFEVQLRTDSPVSTNETSGYRNVIASDSKVMEIARSDEKQKGSHGPDADPDDSGPLLRKRTPITYGLDTEPGIVSERVQKRRRISAESADGHVVLKKEPLSQDVVIKSEEDTGAESSILGGMIATGPTLDSLDLDDAAGITKTPRKRKSFVHVNSMTHSFDGACNDGTKQSHGVQETTISFKESPASDLDISYGASTYLPRGATRTTPTQNHRDVSVHVEAKAYDMDESTPPICTLHDQNRLPFLSGQRSSNSCIKAAKAISALAEDGEDLTPLRAAKVPKDSENAAFQSPTEYSKRLGNLLNEAQNVKHGSKRKGNGSRTALEGQENQCRSSNVTQTPNYNVWKAAERSAEKMSAQNDARQIAELRATPAKHDKKHSVSPEDEPLRARPVQRLGLSDFRLNPVHSKYAYHETIRKHDEKKARGGCLDPFCQRCKDLVTFMESSGVATDDATMLRKFLGKSVKELESLSKNEKDVLMPKAKRAYFATNFGKHRQGQRTAPSEPPGFWNTDFPSTQENLRLREEAKCLERAKIAERWGEAMRDGGLWVFADELKTTFGGRSAATEGLQ